MGKSIIDRMVAINTNKVQLLFIPHRHAIRKAGPKQLTKREEAILIV